MKIKVKIVKEIEVTQLLVDAYPRYWEDAEVNGIKDVNGDLIPCRVGDAWRPLIDLDSGKVTNWKKGVVAKIHFKVCDRGSYRLIDSNGQAHLSIEESYVPSILCPERGGYGDYIIMNIGENGQIENWFDKPPIHEFYEED